MSIVSTDSGQEPNTGRGQGSSCPGATATLRSHCQMCDLREVLHSSTGTVLTPSAAASLASARHPRGQPVPAVSSSCPPGLGSGAARPAAASGHRQGRPEAPHPEQREHRTRCATATGAEYSWGGTAAMRVSPHPCDLWLIKTLRPRALFPARAQCEQDNPPLLQCLPLTCREQAQGNFMIPPKVQAGVEGKPYEEWPAGD